MAPTDRATSTNPRYGDRQFLENPFYGVRQMTWRLQNEGHAVNQRSLVANERRPLEHLDHVGALGPQTLVAHSTLVTPHELVLLHDNRTAVAYNPVASLWKGNAIAPAVMMAEMGIRFGLGTDGTRADGFRLIEAAEGLQRACFGLAIGDSSCGAAIRCRANDATPLKRGRAVRTMLRR